MIDVDIEKLFTGEIRQEKSRIIDIINRILTKRGRYNHKNCIIKSHGGQRVLNRVKIWD